MRISSSVNAHSVFAGDRHCLMYVKLSYKHELYEECERFCKEVVEKSSNYESATINTVILFQGKASYYIFKQNLMAIKKIPKNSPQYFKEREVCLTDAKNAIRLLGIALDNTSIDDEGSRLLDIVMMLALTESSSLNRCLLCRSKQRKLVQSHICPHAILRDFAEACGKPSDGKAFFVNWPWQPALSGNQKAAGQISVNLLCHDCELILSKNESMFLPKFFRKFYDKSDPFRIEIEQDIEYDEWLYQFCVGLIFRGMTFQYSGHRDEFLNEDEVYSIFLQCRETLLNSKCGLQLSLHIAPIATTSELELSSTLINMVIHHPFQFFFTHMKSVFRDHQLSSRALSYTFRIGMIMTTVNFTPAHWKVHRSSVISPSKGIFRVLPNCDRRQAIPDALWETLLIKAMDMEKQVMEQPQRKNLPLDQQPTSYMKNIWDADVTSSDRKVERSFLQFHPKIITHLPSDMSISHFHELNNPTGKLQLPSGHRVLLHLTIPREVEAGSTIFILAGEGPGYDNNTPYLICHHYEPGLQTNYGFFFSPSTFEFDHYLPDRTPKRFLEKGLKSSGLMEKSKALVSLVLKTKGFRNYHSLQYWIQAKRYERLTL